jgi:hypothetical protein
VMWTSFALVIVIGELMRDIMCYNIYIFLCIATRTNWDVCLDLSIYFCFYVGSGQANLV